MAVIELAGVALAALLSENFVLVSCIGIGTRLRAFQDPIDALRTGYCLTAVMVLSALLSWLADFLVLTRFGWQHFRLLFLCLLIPGIIAGLRLFVRVCLPELSRPPWAVPCLSASAAMAWARPWCSPCSAARGPRWPWPALPACGRRSAFTTVPGASRGCPSSSSLPGSWPWRWLASMDCT